MHQLTMNCGIIAMQIRFDLLIATIFVCFSTEIEHKPDQIAIERKPD